MTRPLLYAAILLALAYALYATRDGNHGPPVSTSGHVLDGWR